MTSIETRKIDRWFRIWNDDQVAGSDAFRMEVKPWRSITWNYILVTGYPRPVLAFGYCRCLRLSVRQSVRHQVCPRDNSSPVQARITKFGP